MKNKKEQELSYIDEVNIAIAMWEDIKKRIEKRPDAPNIVENTKANYAKLFELDWPFNCVLCKYYFNIGNLNMPIISCNSECPLAKYDIKQRESPLTNCFGHTTPYRVASDDDANVEDRVEACYTIIDALTYERSRLLKEEVLKIKEKYRMIMHD